MESSKTVATLVRELGESLAAYRLSRNILQEDVAERAGVSTGVVIRLETGKGGTVDSLVRVVKALGCEDRITGLVPRAAANPLDPRSVKGPRRRARKTRDGDGDGGPWTWSE